MSSLIILGGLAKLGTVFIKKYSLRKLFIAGGIGLSSISQWQKHKFYEERNKEMKKRNEEYEARRKYHEERYIK